MTRLIDANKLKEDFLESRKYIEDRFRCCEVLEKIDNAPTVEGEELTPLVNKVVEILPELIDSIIAVLPEIVNKLIKCSECSYYRDTWNVIPRPKGEWIAYQEGRWIYAKCPECEYINNVKTNFCPNCGIPMEVHREQN